MKLRKKEPPQSVVGEAWQNMSRDLDRWLPAKLRGKGKWKISLGMAAVELLVLGVVGKLIYDWIRAH